MPPKKVSPELNSIFSSPSASLDSSSVDPSSLTKPQPGAALPSFPLPPSSTTELEFPFLVSTSSIDVSFRLMPLPLKQPNGTSGSLAEKRFRETLESYQESVEPIDDDEDVHSTSTCSRTILPTSFTLPARGHDSPGGGKTEANPLCKLPVSSSTVPPRPPSSFAQRPSNSTSSPGMANSSPLSPLQSLPSSTKRARHATFAALDSTNNNEKEEPVPPYPSSQPCSPGHSLTDEDRQVLMQQRNNYLETDGPTVHSMNGIFPRQRSSARFGGQNEGTFNNINNATLTLPNSNSRASCGGAKKTRKKIRKLGVKIHAYATPAHAYYPLHAEEESKVLPNLSIGGLGSTRLLTAAAAAARHNEERKRARVISPSEGKDKDVSRENNEGSELSKIKGKETAQSNHSVALYENMNSNSNLFMKQKAKERVNPLNSENSTLGSSAQQKRRLSLKLHLSQNASFEDNSSISFGRRRNSTTGLGASPRENFREAPPNLEGRRWEAQRFSLPTCPPYRIPLYDQAVFKYVFDSLFVDHITLMQYFFLIQSVAMFVLNLIMTVVNVVSAVTFTQEISPWITTAATVCFLLEFAVTVICLLFLIVVMLEAIIFNNIGTSLAHDISFLITLGGSFSVLRFAGLATPLFAMRRIVPLFQRASSAGDYCIGIISIILWIFACFISFLVLISKASQIYFALVLPIPSWTIMDYIRLVGLCVNLSRVDDSYFKEMSVLLDAAHRHYAFPGEAEEAHPYEKICLLSRIRVFFRIPMYMYFTLFDTVYNFHWRSKYEREELLSNLRREEKEKQAMRRKERKKKNDLAATRQVVDGTVEPNTEPHSSVAENRRQRVAAAAAADASQQEKEIQNLSGDRHYRHTRLPRGRRMWLMFNYLAFIFEVDPVQLRRYLQMVQSPLPYYQLGRDAFMKAFMDNDLVGMNMAVRNSEPQSTATANYAKEDPQQFSPAFTCDDGRTLWDSTACMEQWNRKDLERTKQMIRCLQFAEKFKYY